MTALQVIIKEAKAIRNKNPKMEWKKAVAQASAIYAKKHKGKSPVGKKKVAKKVVRKKAAKKRIGTIKKKAAKKVVRKKRITETGILNRIRKVKKDVKRLDEAQHKHMSKLGAVSSHIIHEVKEAHNKLIHWQKALMMLENTRKTLPASMKKYNSMDIKRVKEAIKEQKTHIAQLKKHIK
jgi:hypothetical protein